MKKNIAIILIFWLAILTGQAQTSDTLTASPNPFPTSTDLTIHNLSSDTVTLKVYDRWGSLITTFFENLVLSGTVTVTFNADTLPDDLYVAVLTLNSKFYGKGITKSQTATGFTDVKNDLATIQVYPNPTSDLLTISTDLQITELEIYDSNGKRVFKTTNGQQKTIDLKSFDSGLYLLIVETNNQTYIKKILKN